MGLRGLLFLAVCGLRIREQARGTQASVVMACEICCPTACGVFLDQGLNPCSLHWQADT